MKWYEFKDDLGDGTTRAVRFKTKEEAVRARNWAETCSYFQCDGDGSPVTEVDTDNSWFFATVEDFTEGELT
jgi:hypothetical protein